MGISIHNIQVNTASLADGHSIAAYLTSAAGTLLTHSTSGGKVALDTYGVNVFAVDGAYVPGSLSSLSAGIRRDADTSPVDADGDIHPFVFSSAGRLKVDANLSASFDYVYPEDSPFVNADQLAAVGLVRQDTLAASTSTDGDYGNFKSNNLGELYVFDTTTHTQLTTANGHLSTISTNSGTIATNTGTTATNTGTIAATLTALSKAEDAVHSSGDQGIQALAVRKDSQGSNAADGDYTSLQTWSEGSAKVVDIRNSTILQQQISVTNVATALPTSALANRKTLVAQNTSASKMWIGSATVTTSGAAAGLELSTNDTVEFTLGPAAVLYAIKVGATGATMNVLELS